MKYKLLPDKETLNNIFEYKDGNLFWKERKAGRPRKIAGNKSGRYARVMINLEAHLLHRVVYAMFKHDPTDFQIDHINGDRFDNRIENLRLASPSENKQNIRKAKKGNIHKLLGVCFRKDRNRYYSTLTINGKKKFLGYFDTPEEAHKAHIEAKRKHHDFCTI